MLALLICFCAFLVQPKVYFAEEFKKGWREHWVESQAHAKDGTKGTWGWDAGKWYGDFEENMGMKTMDHKSNYQISADLGETFSNKGKTLVISYTVKFDQTIDCGGGYIKLLPDTVNQTEFDGNSTFYIMFGPDVYLHLKRDVQFFYNYEGKMYECRRPLKMADDLVTHMYTLIIRPDNTYDILIDGDRYRQGSFADDFDIIHRRWIPDTDAKKPDDWEDSPEIVDPTDKKPDDWDDREMIPDPRALQPADWDEKKNGPWVAPMIKNPTYQGEYIQRLLPNPKYKGEWKPPVTENPLWAKKDDIYVMPAIRYIGVDIWQVKAGTIFDNFFVGDSVEEWAEFAQRTFFNTMETERWMFKLEDERIKEKEKREKDAIKRNARRGSGYDEPIPDDDD